MRWLMGALLLALVAGCRTPPLGVPGAGADLAVADLAVAGVAVADLAVAGMPAADMAFVSCSGSPCAPNQICVEACLQPIRCVDVPPSCADQPSCGTCPIATLCAGSPVTGSAACVGYLGGVLICACE